MKLACHIANLVLAAAASFVGWIVLDEFVRIGLISSGNLIALAILVSAWASNFARLDS